MILHTRTHKSTRAEKCEPKKGLSGPQKGLRNLEKMIFCKYCSKFDGALHPYCLLVLCAPTHGWLRWGVRLTLEKKRCTKKVKNHRTERID